MTQLNLGLSIVSAGWTTTGNAAVSSSMGMIAGASESSASMGILQRSIGFVADMFHYVKIVWQSVVKDFLGGLAQVLDGLASVYKYLVVIQPRLLLFGKTKDVRDLAEGIRTLGREYEESLVAEMAKPLPSEGINALFSDARKRMEAIQAEAGKSAAMGAFAAGSPSAAAKAGKPRELQFASAMSSGSQEAVNTVLRSRFGGGNSRNKPAEDTAKNTATTAELLRSLPKRMADAIGRHNFEMARPMSSNGTGNWNKPDGGLPTTWDSADGIKSSPCAR